MSSPVARPRRRGTGPDAAPGATAARASVRAAGARFRDSPRAAPAVVVAPAAP